MDEDTVIRSLSALAQSHRLKAFRLLVQAGPQGATPGELAESLSVPAATLSFHLKEMSYAGLISQERQGRNIVYRAAFEHMNALLAFLTDNCCQGQACMPVETGACPC